MILYHFIEFDTSSLLIHLFFYLWVYPPMPIGISTHEYYTFLDAPPRILRALCLAVVVTAAALTAASAQVVLYTTTDDFAQFGGTNGIGTSTDFFSVDNTTNGVGNSTNAGGTGANGSFEFAGQNGWGPISGTDFIGPTSAAFNACFPDSIQQYSAASGGGPGTMVAGSGTISYDLNTANMTGYSYVQWGIHFNYNGNWVNFGASSTTDFTGADGTTWTHVVVPYTTADTGSGGLSYFGWSLFENSGGGAGGEIVYLDNIQVAANAVPEPATTALLMLGGLGTVLLYRRRKNCLKG